MRKIATSLIDILVICCLCMALIGPYVFTRRSVRGTDDELLFERVSSRKASIYVPIIHCSNNSDKCPAKLYEDYLQSVPTEFRVCGECVQELKFYKTKGKPYSYRMYNASNYPSIQFGKTMSYRLYPRLKNNFGYQVLFMIISAAGENQERMIIRENFRSLQSRYRIGYFFVTAMNSKYNSSLFKENLVYRDILQLSHTDSYHNLVLSVLGGFHFVSRFRDLAEYVMKTDSDCVVNIPELMHYLNKTEKDHPQYIGKCSKKWHFNVVDPKQKNWVPLELVGVRNHFTGYASGGGYILRFSAIPRLLVAVRHLPFITHLEDVTVGLAASSLKYRCTNKVPWIARRGCETQESCLKYMIMHKNESNSEIIRFWSYIR